MRNKLKFPGLLVIVALASSCNKDLNKFGESWQPSVAAPLVDARLSFENIISAADSNYIKSGPDKFLTFVYKTNLPSQNAATIVPVPNTTDKGVKRLSSAEILTLNTLGSVNTNLNDSVKFTFNNNARLDHIEFKAGVLNYHFKSWLKDSIKFNLTIPSLTNGASFTIPVALHYTSGATLPIQVDGSVDLNGYKLTLNNNKMAYGAAINVKDLGFGTTTTDSLTYSVDVSGLKYAYADGYLGNFPFVVPVDSMEMNFFKNSVKNANGSVEVEDPQIKVNISNSFGIPIGLNFTKFDAVLDDDSRVKIANINQKLNIPADRNAPPANTLIQITKAQPSGSKLGQVISGKPKRFIYGVTATANPSGNDTLNFVKDTSEFKASVEMNIPLKLKLKNLTIQDTFPSSSFSGDQMDKLVSATFKIVTSNGFPLDAGFQIYFYQNNTKLDSLVSPYQSILPSGIPSGPDGRTIPSPLKPFEVTYDRARLDKIKGANKIVMRAVLNTYDSQNTFVKFYSDYAVRIKMGMLTKLKPVN